MSSQNPLSKFRSYRYYHIIAMCDTSDTASQLINLNTVDAWQHPTGVTASPEFDMLGKYAPKATPSGGKYIILINGAEDADLIIEKMNFMSSTAGKAVFGDAGSSVFGDGSLTVTEPHGMNFLDILVLSAMALNCELVTATVVIKTIFVGYTDDGRIETIANSAPLESMIYDLKANVTEKGGTYVISFLAQAGGTARLPTYSNIGTGIKMAIKSTANMPSVTLSRALATLQSKVQAQYEEQYSCIMTSVEYAQSESGIGEDLTNRLSRISYFISLDEMYDDSYVVTDAPSEYKDVGMCNEGIYIDSGPNSSIETIIRSIMDRCPKVAQDASGVGSDNTKFPEGSKVTYKIKAVTRTTTTEDGNVEYQVYYHVYPFRAPNSISSTEIDSGVGISLFEFDYMYTGLNTDVLKFDIDMPFGAQYINVASINNSFMDQLEVVNSRTTTSPNIFHRLKSSGSNAKLPVPFGNQVVSQTLVNTQNPVNTTNMVYTLANAAVVNQFSVTMEIVGNPLLMSVINSSHTTDPELFKSSGMINLASVDLTSSDGVPQPSLYNWLDGPTFAKVNINMPINNDPLQLMLSGSGYSRPFWYDGKYIVLTCNSKFEGGVFTQELEMMMHIEDAAKYDITTNNKFISSFQKGTEQCYDNRMFITPNQNQTAYQNAEPFPSVNEDSTKVSQYILNRARSNKEMCVVTGWDKASPRVQAAILDAAELYGVDPILMGMIASRESNFNPAAKPPASYKSTASGLYQHVKDTWNGLVKAGKVQGVPANTPEYKSLALRFDPVYSARGGAAYIRDIVKSVGSDSPGMVYLAYFAGEPTAKKIIRGANAGQTLKAAIGDKLFKKYQSSNPNVITSENFPAASLISWAENKMAKESLRGTCAKSMMPTESELDAAKTIKIPADVEESLGNLTTKGNVQQTANTPSATDNPYLVEAGVEAYLEKISKEHKEGPNANNPYLVDADVEESLGSVTASGLPGSNQASLSSIDRGEDAYSNDQVDIVISRSGAEAISIVTDPAILEKQRQSVCGIGKLPETTEDIKDNTNVVSNDAASSASNPSPTTVTGVSVS